MVNEEKNGTGECKRKLNILVVEDNLTIQRVIEQILASVECRLDLVLNGKKALEALEMNHYDLILMDLEMPEMNGFETTAHIRAMELAKGEGAPARTPILAMMGHHLENGRQRCMSAGMDDYLEKPFVIAEFLETIERLTHSKICAK